MRYQVYWTPETQLIELQGAVIDFKAYNEVEFQHQFLPSGQPIVGWYSQANYLNTKTMSDLPYLYPGETYYFDRQVVNSERMHAYLAVTFYDKDGLALDTKQQNADCIEVTVPEGTDYYEVKLLSAGTGSFIFRGFNIRPKVEEGYLLSGDQQLNDDLYAYLDVPKNLKNKTLRVIFSEPEFHSLKYVNDLISPSNQAVLYFTTDLLHADSYLKTDLAEEINKAKKAVHANKIEFVGYGLISSYTALTYQGKFRGSHAVISDPSADQKVPYLERMSPALRDQFKNISVRISESLTGSFEFLTSAFANDLRVPVMVPHPNEDRLASLRYDTAITDYTRADTMPQHASHQEKKKSSKLHSGRLRNFFMNED